MTYADFNIEIPQGRTTGQVYTKCPNCSHDRKKKNVKCLGVNLDLGIWHCNHCDWKGTIKQAEKKKYVRPVWNNKTTLSDKLVEFCAQRNISQDTLLKMRVTQDTVWMPQLDKEVGAICFNYFKGGELINIKYRDKDKNFRMVKDAELIVYNYDAINGQKEIFITEGEFDCLVMVQSGIESTCSVPNGANKKNNNLEYLDNCWQAFENAEKIYIVTDNDEPGEKLAGEISRRLGVERCWRVILSPYKDVNEALNQAEPVSREWILARSNAYPLEGVYSASDFWDKLLSIKKNGFPKGWKPRGEFGNHVTIHPGYQTIITGIPSHGKSEHLDQTLIEITLDYDLRGAFFSPENHPTELHIMKLIEKLAGRDIWKMSETELIGFRDWIEKRIHWVYPEEGFGIENICNHIKSAIKRYGINWYVIDAWNKLDHQYSNSETAYISWALEFLGAFNRKNNVHGFLIAHPTKMEKDKNGIFLVPNLYSISGSSHFYNKADIGWTIYKPKDGETEIHIQKVKFKWWGHIGMVKMFWNKENGRYYSINPDVSNWLTTKNETTIADDELPF